MVADPTVLFGHVLFGPRSATRGFPIRGSLQLTCERPALSISLGAAPIRQAPEAAAGDRLERDATTFVGVSQERLPYPLSKWAFDKVVALSLLLAVSPLAAAVVVAIGLD